MTLRNAQRAVWLLMVVGALGLGAASRAAAQNAPAQSDPPTANEQEPTTTQEAIERLMELRDKLEAEEARQPKNQAGAEEERKANEPRTRRMPPQREPQRTRRPSIEELRQRAQSPSERAPREARTREEMGNGADVEEMKFPERQEVEDLMGPPYYMALTREELDKQRGGAPASRSAERPREDEETGESPAESSADPARHGLTRREMLTEKTDWFNFSDADWSEVIKLFVDRIGKPLMSQEPLIPGTLTYISDRTFTKDEAIDELNLIMYEQGYRFVEQEHHVRVIPVNEMRQWVPVDKTYPSVKAFEEDDPSDMDYVVVYYQVSDNPAQLYVDAFSDALPIDALMEVVGDTNQIKISALARDVREFLLLKDLVDLSPQDPRQLKIFDIQTNARDIERMVRDFLNLSSGPQIQMERDPRSGRMVPRRVSSGEDSDVQMVADDRTNSIIVKATKDKMKEIEALIEQFDKKPEIGEFTTKIVKVHHADATEIANLMNQIFQQEQGESRTPTWQLQRRLQQARQQAQRSRRGREPTRRTTPQQAPGASPEDILAEGIFERAKKTIRIIAEPRQNLLFVYANDDGHQRVQEMLADIDQPEPDNYAEIPVEHADVDAIAPMLTEIVSSSSTGTGRAASIVADAQRGVFHVVAERDDMEKIRKLITQLDVPAAELTKHIIELENLRPSDVAQMIQSLLESGAAAPRRLSRAIRGRVRGGASGGSVSEAPTYKLIPLDDAQVLIVFCADEDWERIDETVRLWDSRALTSTPVLEKFVIEKGDPVAIAEMLGQFYRNYRHPILGNSTVAIQAEGNTLLVYGVRPALDEIGSLIEGLDFEAIDDAIEILPLVHADANDVAQQVQTFMGLRVGRGRGPVMAGGPVIQAEPVTNSLIVQANPNDMAKIKDFAMELDAKFGLQEPVQKFFIPRYAAARDVATAILQVYGGGVGRGRQPTSAQIKAFAAGQQVVVEAPQAKMAEIEAFINQLDDPQGKEIVIKTVKLEGADVAQIARKLATAFQRKPNSTALFDADQSSETILLTCSADILQEAEDLIAEYREISQGQVPVVEFRQMQYAQASDAARWLNEQLVTYMTPIMGRRASQQIQVTADTRTNRVVINAPNVAVEYGKKLLEQYDVEVVTQPQPPMFTDARKLPGLDVRALANNLTTAFRNRPRRPDGLTASFSHDDATETLIISAPKDMAGEIEELIGKFAAETQDLVNERRFFKLTEADVNYVAGQLRPLLVEPLRQTKGRGVSDRISIVADTRQNQLVIDAPKLVMPIAEELIAQLDQPPTVEEQVRTIPLANADAGTVNNVLRQIFSEKIRSRTLNISAEPMTNSLIVGGSQEDFEIIEKWAKDLDEQAIVKRGALQIIELLNANPWEIANILNAQYGGGGRGRKYKLGEEFSFQIVGGRSIVAQAPEDKMPEILELVERLDQVGVDKVEVRIYELPGIGSGIYDLANQVTQAFNNQQELRERRITITPYPAADTLVVTARADQFPEIESMMERFKEMVGKETTITKFIKLEYLDAGRYAGQIQNMLANKISREGQRSSRALQTLQILADPRTNQLICYIPEKILPDLEELLAQLDVEAPDYEGQLRTIELAHADANSVAQALRPMFEQVRNQARGQDMSQIVVRIHPEPITNSLLVTASDEDFEQIQKQALWMDERALLGGNEAQVVNLAYADPNDVANLINQWFGRGRGGRGLNQAQQTQAAVSNGVLVVSAPKQEFEEISKLIQEVDRQDPSGVQIKSYDLKVLSASQVQMAVAGLLRDIGKNVRKGQLKPGAFAEPATNTLVVMAPAETLPLIDQIIADLEGKAPQQAEAKSYILENARADQIARNIDQMLQAKVAEREGSNKRTTVQTLVYADAATNRLFVYAPEDYQQLAAELIRMVDEEVETTDIVHIVTIEDGDAVAIAQSVDKIVQGNRKGSGSPGAQSGTATVRISADADSNSIILAGMPKDLAEVESWIEELASNSTRIPELQIFPLTYMSTDMMEQTLQTRFGGGMGGGRGGRGGAGATSQVSITTDELNNRLIISANRYLMRQVEAYIKELDIPPTSQTMFAGGRELYFVDISKGSASNIAWDVRDLLPPEELGGPSIEADWFDEYLIVKCRPSEFPQVLSLIREFERRSKVEIVQRVFEPRGLDPEQLMEYIRLRGEAENVELIKPPKPSESKTIVEELWPEGQTPPAGRTEAPREQPGVHGASRRSVPMRDLMSRRDALLEDIERELFRTLDRKPSRLGARTGPAAPLFRPALFTPAPDQEDPPAPRPTTRPAAPPAAATPPPPIPTPRAPLQEIPAEFGAGETVASPIDKEPVRISVQPDGRLMIQGPQDKVDDIADVINTFQEDRSVGEVIRIFKFRYGDVTAAAEVLNIMFDVRQRQIIIPQQPQRDRRTGERDEDDRSGRGGFMDQIQGMIGGRRGQQGDQAPRMRIATDPGHNYLIIKSDEADLPEIRRLLRELDIPPGEVNLRVFQLRNLDATETAENIKDVLGISEVQQRRGGPRAAPQGRGGRGQEQLLEMLQQQMVSVPGVTGGAKVERVEIVPNAVTNSLMVSAPPEVMTVVENVINELEKLEGHNNIVIQHYELKDAQVDDILPLLQQIFDATAGGGGGRPGRAGRGGGGGASPGQMGPVTVSGDPRTNTLIYTCEAKDVEIVEKQIRELDIPGAVSETEMYVCQYGDAEAIAAQIEAIFLDAGGRGGRGGQADTPGMDVRISAHSATNTILVRGPRDKRDQIFLQIMELDRQSERPIRELDVVYADPVELAETLSGIFAGGGGGARPGGGRRGGGGPAVLSGGAVTIVGDKAAKKLLVRAPDEMFLQIQNLVEALDKPSEQMKLKSFPLRYANAEFLVDQLKSALADYVQAAKATGEDVDFDAFTVVPDTRTNSVVVVGSEETFAFVAEVLGTIDVESPIKKEFRVFMLERADAVTVAEAINGFATGGAAGGGGGRSGRRGGGGAQGGPREFDVIAEADETTNAVLVYGRAEDIALVETSIIERYEDSIADRMQIATIQVQNAPPSQVVTYIWQFIDQSGGAGQAQGQGRRGQRGSLTEDGGPQIVPNDSDKTLIVRGTRRQIDEVRELAARFDNEAFGAVLNKVIPVPYGQDPVALADMLERIVNESETESAEQSGRRPRRVTVDADVYTNTLIVAGDPTLFGYVTTIMDQLKGVRSATAVTRVIQLNNLSAEDAQEIINDLQSQSGRGGSGARRSGGSRGSSGGAPASGGSRRSRGRSDLLPDQRPDLGQERLMRRPLLLVEPYVATSILSPVIGVLAGFGPPPDQPETQPAPPPEAEKLRELRRRALEALKQDAERRPAEEAQEPPQRQRPRRERPQAERERPSEERERGARPQPPPPPAVEAQPASAPAAPGSGILDTLSGVSGTLKGDITAQAVDSQRIIITGDEDDVAFVEQILMMMEQSSSPAIIEVFTLRAAKATALAPIIETAIQAQIDAYTSRPGPQDKFSINAEGRSNSLIVSASEKIMQLVDELVQRLDVDKTDGTIFSTVVLQNMRAVEAVALLKPTIQKLNDQREIPKESQASISAIERNNSVMIVGTPKDVEEISALVKTVDVPLTRGDDDMQSSFTTADVILVQLQNAQATNVAEVLTTMIEEQQENARQVDPEKPGEPFVKVLRLRLPDGRELPDLNLDRPIKIIPEEGTNSLIIFSSKENNEAITEIVQVFDTLPVGAETDVKAFTLRHALAEEVATLVQEIFEKKRYIKRPSEGDDDNLQDGILPPVPPGVAAQGLPYPLLVQHDVRSNTVFVIGRKDAVILAGGLIQELDRPTTDIGVQAFLLPLKRMQAAPLAEKLESLLDDRAQALGADKNEGRDNAVVLPDERSNSLIIFATPEMFELVEDLALQLDATDKYSTVDVRYRPLKHADALKLQGLLEEMFEAKEQAESDLNPDAKDTLNIQADIRSNSLLLTGTLDYLDEAEALVNQLDQEFDGTVVFQAFKIKLNSAANLAALLTDMIDKTLKQQDSSLSGSAIHVAADPISDTLLVAAAREDMTLISRWIDILDRPSEVGRMTRIIPLRRAVAEDASQAARDIFDFPTGQGGEVDITITAETMTNSVVVFGPPGLVQDIEEFVRQLDQVEVQGQAIVRIFKLDQADAEVAGELLTKILEGEGGSVGSSGGGGGGGSREQAANQVMLIWQQQHPETGMETMQAMRSAVTVLSDLRTNSLIVTAAPESMALMESLIAAIDVPPDAAKIRVFALRNSDAEQMVQMLQELFERQSVTTGTGEGETERILTVDGLGGQGGRQEIAFTTDVRTNSVIAAGTPGYLDLVEELVLTLDTTPIKERETTVYAPKNITAQTLADSIREFSEAEQQRLQDIGDEVSISVRQEREIVAIANEDANRLLLDFDPRFRDTVMRVVEELDQAPPQVMIQVLILEVTMDNELEIGVEFAFQDLQWSDGDPDSSTRYDYVGGTDLGAAGSGLGGFTFTITGKDFNFLFRTLQNEGSLKVLSRPQIMAMDNQEAIINVSDNVPYVSGTQTSSTGQISTQVNRRDVGIVLTVTPQINPEGFVRMHVRQEVNEISGSTIDVGQGVTSPIFFVREAETDLMVRDNETIVLGGLIETRNENREQKVPILGDIPGLGLLFRNQNDSQQRAELLIVLTPHVIRSPEEFRELSIAEVGNMELIPAESLSDELMQGLQVHLDEFSEGGEYAIPKEGAAPPPAAPAAEPAEEVYGPMRPALHPDRREDLDPNSYDVPREWRTGRHRA